MMHKERKKSMLDIEENLRKLEILREKLKSLGDSL